MLGESWFALAVGVHCISPCSDDEYAIAEVRGADGGSWYAVPFRVIPERGQIGLDISESESKVP